MSDFVWIVTGVDAHGSDILGVFGSEEKANNFINSDDEDLDNNYASIWVSKREVQ